MRYLAWCVCTALLIGSLAAAPTQAAEPAHDRSRVGSLSLVCVDRDDHRVRRSSGSCSRGERPVGLSVTHPVRLCKASRSVLLAVGAAACARRGGRSFRAPSSRPEIFCADPRRGGRLRSVPRIAACRRREDPLRVRDARPGVPALSRTRITENVRVGTEVGALSAVDPDAGDRLAFALVAGPGDTDNAAFSVDGDVLRTAAPIDHEAQSLYRLRIRVTDLLGRSRETALRVGVVDVEENHDPTGVALSPGVVGENLPAGSTVGTLTTTDPDPADRHSYTLVSTAGQPDDDALFTVDGDQLRTTAPLDFEAGATRHLRVRSDDGHGGAVEQDLSVSVTDANDAPTRVSLAPASVPENAASREVGTLTAEDQDAGDTHTFELVSGAGDGDNARFAVVGDRLRTTGGLDFETRSSYSLRIRATDAAGATAETRLEVTATDTDDAPTAVTLSPSSVAENQPAGTAVGALSVTDQDAGDSHHLELVGGAGDTDNGLFEIRGSTLVTTQAFDYEGTALHSIRVRATDAAGRSVESVLTVTVTNVNEPPSALDLSNSTVAEAQAAGAVVGTLTSTDPDAFDSATYDLVAGTGDDDNAAFRVDGDRLEAAGPLDYEARSAYSVRVRSTDGGGTSVERAFTISVLDVNEAPTDLSLGADTVAENLPPGTPVGTLTGTDPDPGDSLSYALVAGAGDTDNGSFTLVNGVLETAATFDYESGSSYSVRVRVSDDATPGLWLERSFTVHVSDVNEAPAQLQLDPAAVPENAAPGTVVGRLSVLDPDAGQTASYQFVAGPGDTDNGHFSVVGDQLVALDPFDHEVQDTYAVRVRATDSGTPALAVDGSLTVHVADRNDAPTALTLSGSHVTESAPVGTVVGTLTTTDQDAGDGHTYSLTGGADAGSFEIAGDQLRTTGALDHETRPTLTIRVRTDDGHGGTLDQAFTIAVDDVNEAPTGLALSSASVPENTTGAVVGDLVPVDADGAAPFTYALVAGTGDADNAHFSVDAGRLVAVDALDFEAGSTRSVRVRVTDAGGLSYTTPLTVTVTNADDAPSGVVLSAADVPENAPLDTAVGSLSSIDQDAGDTHTYALVTGTGDADNSSFALTADGALATAVTFDYEADATRSIRVRSTDAAGASVDQVLTVTVTNVNEPPSALDLSTSTVAEAKAAGAVVGTLASTDPDATDSATYSLVTGTGDDDNGLFTIVGDQLCTTAPLDYETAPSLTVRIRVTDGGDLRVERAFAIAVTNVNEAPTGIALSGSTVPENSPATLVGTLSAVDADSAGPFVYELPAAAADNADFTVNGDQLSAVPGLDFEAGPSRSVRVRVTDPGGQSYAQTLTVTVLDRNDAPTAILPATLSVPENLAAGAVVGQLVAVDQDGSGGHTFTLLPGMADNSSFALTSTGELSTAVTFDHETTAAYTVRAEVSDGTATYRQDLPVTVLDTNDAPTSIGLSSGAVPEDAALGTTVGQLSTADQDAGDTHTYSLVPGTGGEDDAAFTIAGNELRTAAELDYETKPLLHVLVESADGRGGTITSALTIGVSDVNEAPTGLSLSSATVPENAAGAVVGDLVAVDEDTAAPFTYALVAGAGDTDNTHFSISSGQLVATDPFDFEGGPGTRSVRVQVTDAGGLSYAQALTVAVTDANDAPTGVVMTGGTIAEDAAVGTEVGTLTSQDQDAGDTHTYELLDDAAGAFALTTTGVLTTAAALDYESAPAPTIRVRTTDGSGAPYEQDLTVAVEDVNEPATSISLSDASVTENQPVGTLVGTLSTDDPESAEGQAYELVSGTGADDNAKFQITGDRLETAAVLDAAAAAGGLHVRVRATDTAGHWVEQALTITVRLQNRAPTGVTLADHSVDENSPIGTLVGTLGWTDPDAGDTPSYSLVTGTGGDDNAQFAVDAATGELTTAASFDFETNPSYSIRVRVTDSGGLGFEQPLTVDVADVNEAPVAAADSFSGAIGNTLGTAGSISTTGPVAVLAGALPLANDKDPEGNTLTVVPATSSSTGGGAVTIQADGSFSYLPPAGLKDTTDTFDYTVTDGNLTDTGTVTVTIANRLVWYVDDNAAATGTPDGRSASPYASLTPLDGTGGVGDPDGPGDEIFLRSGSYSAGLALEPNQSLVGEGVALPGIVAKGTSPTISDSSSAGVISLANGSSVDGLDVLGDSLLAAHAVTNAQVGSAVTLTGLGADPIIEINGAASGDITIAASVTSRNSGNAVDVRDRTGGTVAFTGAIATRRDMAPVGSGGIVLASNTGATVSFAGGLQLTTDGNNAFSATGGGTVVVTGPDNTLTTTTGTPLKVSGVTIGGAGLTFRSVSTTGGPNGIVLANTGTQGSLSVTGNSTGACGGATSASGTVTTAAVAGDCTGGTLSGTTGPAVLLSNTSAPSLTRLHITGSGDDGIRATGVSGLTLAHSLVENNGNATGEDGLDLGDSSATSPQGVTGRTEITGSTIRGSGADNLVLRNTSGTATLVVSGSQLANAGTAGSGGNIIEESIGSAATIGNAITSNNITGSKDADQIEIRSRAVGTTGGVGGTIASALIQDNTIMAGTGTVGGGIRIVGDETQGNASNPYAWTGSVHFDVDGNTMSGALGDAVRFVEMKSQTGASFSGYVRRNTIGTSGGYRSCAGGATGTGLPTAGTGIRADNEGDGALTLAITDNQLYRCWRQGIGLHVGHGDSTLEATVTDNVITLSDVDAAQGMPESAIYTDMGSSETDTNNSCLDFSGNSGADSNSTFASITYLQASQGVVRVKGLSGVGTAASVQQWWADTNTLGFGAMGEVYVQQDFGTFQGATGCAAPN